jgi:hypothetical protein
VQSQAQSGGSPRRLICEDGKWVLEVVRHVNLGHDLIRPTTERLTGRRAISSYFDKNPEQQLLAKATLRLMSAEPDGPVSYNAVGGEWIANSMPPPRPEREVASPPRRSLETQIVELEARVVLLSAVQEGLLARLARLEARVAKGVVGVPGSGVERIGDRRRSADGVEGASELDADPGETAGEAPRAGSANAAPAPGQMRAAALREPRVSAADGSGPGGAAEAEREGPAGLARAALESGEAAVALSAPEGGRAPAPHSKRLVLDLPPVQDLARCMSLLIGGDVSAHEGAPLAITRQAKDLYAAALLSDTDEVVGLIVMDLKATVFLGGTLMMLPRGELEQQLKQFSPGEDSVAASGEVCNSLSGALNEAQNVHVRSGPLEKLDPKAWDWIAEPAHRRDVEDSFGGRTAVLARPH